MKISDIVEATNGQLLCGNMNDEVIHITQDTRQIKKGDMYIPLIGENHDGHDFIPNAFDNGASTIITSKEIVDETHNIILVKDTRIALGDMARFVRQKYHPIVIGITGSVGKTSTKDMIYSVVSKKYKTLKTLGNYNNDIGLPLTILRYQDEDAMVIEMGMNHLKEIDYLTKIALPDIAVITNVGTAHIGEVGSREKILEAKMEITHGLKGDGILIINKDNDMLQTVKEDHYQLRTIGIENKSDLNAYDISLDENSSDFKITYDNKEYDVHVEVPGIHFVYNALAAIEVGLNIGISIEEAIDAVGHFELTKNRSDIIECKSIKVMDGTYNASVDSIKASLNVLEKYHTRRIAVLGDMLELGNYEESLHREVGKHIKEHPIEAVFTIGKGASYIHDELMDTTIDTKHFDTNNELISYLHSYLKENDVLLVKASNGMHLKEVVNDLKENF